MRLHRRVGEALEEMPDRSGRLEALAFHFAEAADDGQALKAAGYALDAGRHLIARLAYEGAVSLLERGLAVLERHPAPDLGLRADLLLALGTARANAGDTTGAKEAGLRAGDDARTLGSPELLAEAAEVCFSQTGVGVVDPKVTRLCEEALAALGDRTPLLRARLLARFAFYQASNESRGEAAGPLAEQAIELARQAGDTEVLAAALFGRAVTLLGTERVEQRLALASELLGVAAASDNQEERLQGLFLRGSARLELGDRGGFEADAAELGALAARTPSFKARYYDSAWRVMRTLLDGRFAETPARLAELGEMADTDANARNVHAINTWLLYRETGRLAEVLPLLEAVVARNPALVGFQPALTLSLAELGRADDAARHLESLVADDCATMTRDMNWVASLGGLAEVAAALGHVEAGAVLEELLLPHAGRVVVPAAATYCTGTTERYLGMLAALRGDVATAQARYETALTLEEAIGAPPLAARTRLWWARLLAGAGDAPARATDLAAQSEAAARELGMAGLAAEAAALRADLGRRS
jgi:tetratricopeptide (TPR) repeat protein